MPLTELLARQLCGPTRSAWGRVARRLFELRNAHLELEAAALSGLTPGLSALEVGFGPGLGLVAACRLLGPAGTLLGLERSEYMLDVAGARLKRLAAKGGPAGQVAARAELMLGGVGGQGSVALDEASVDRVFHCNCYYFWPNLEEACAELFRVIKPGGLMVTTLNLASVRRTASYGALKYAYRWEPEPYLEALSQTGFVDVRMEDRQHGSKPFQAIFATKPIVPASPAKQT
uniref:Arsenite methyltransferase-like n=1 Tax=Petromyzon marinus TaxID=7757 RepID=A0AAJ7SU91_PETMA|nr:arsenite methyltransferase-like [Petromyzon marinus]